MLELVNEVAMAHTNLAGCNGPAEKVDRLIAWVPLGEGWVKLNTDGASRGNPGAATAGGVLQDKDGN